MKKRNFLLSGLCAAAALAAAFPAHAQSVWPSRPIKIVVPYPPGGPTDAISRLIGQKLGEKLNTNVVVENRPGGSGVIALTNVSNSPADGYTLTMIGVANLLAKHTVGNTPYDILQDFAPVAMIAELPSVMVVNPQVWPDVNSLQDVIAKAKAASASGKPLNYTTSAPVGIGTMTIETLKDLAHFDMQHVPHSGAAPALQSVMSGEIPMSYMDIIATLPQIRAGKLRAVAVGGPARLPMLPEVKTIAEQGISGFSAISWLGLLMRHNTPASVIDRLNKEIPAILQEKDVQERMQMLGAIPAYRPSGEMRVHMEQDFDKWGAVIRKHRLVP